MSLETRLERLRALVKENDPHDNMGLKADILAAIDAVEEAAEQAEDFEEPEERAEREAQYARRRAEEEAWLAAPDVDEADAWKKRMFRAEKAMAESIDRMVYRDSAAGEIPTLQGLSSHLPFAWKTR